MIDLLLQNPFVFLISSLTLVLAITVHEFAHAFAADRLGDPTPRLMGRLTLNPLSHLDPFGTLFLFLAGFGWGKPVPFDPFNLAHPRRDSAIIALSGPFSNLLVASLISIVLRIFPDLLFVGPIFTTIIYFNVLLAVFNLIPIHPLDGGKILVGLLPPDLARSADRYMNQYGFVLLLFLILPIFGGRSLVSEIISPIISFLVNIYLPRSIFI